jgi:hypothetical protein
VELISRHQVRAAVNEGDQRYFLLSSKAGGSTIMFMNFSPVLSRKPKMRIAASRFPRPRPR